MMILKNLNKIKILKIFGLKKELFDRIKEKYLLEN